MKITQLSIIKSPNHGSLFNVPWFVMVMRERWVPRGQTNQFRKSLNQHIVDTKSLIDPAWIIQRLYLYVKCERRMDSLGKVIFFFLFLICTFWQKKIVPFHAWFNGSWIRQSLSGVCAKCMSPEHKNKFPAGLEQALWPREMLGCRFDRGWRKNQISPCWRACCQTPIGLIFALGGGNAVDHS